MLFKRIDMLAQTGRRIDLGAINDSFTIDVREWLNIGMSIRTDKTATAGYTVSLRYSYDGVDFYDYATPVTVTTETPFSTTDVSAVGYLRVIVTTAGTSGEMVNVVGILKS